MAFKDIFNSASISIQNFGDLPRSINSVRYRVFIIIMMACISSLGTMPYGFRFAQIFETYNQLMYFTLGILFALTAAFANTALGTYSLLAIHNKVIKTNTPFLTIISFASAIPTGCMCFFAYHSILPFYLNVIVTSAVTLINTGIGYTAIGHLILEFKQHRSKTTRLSESFVRIIGLIIGVTASIPACLAAIHELTKLFVALSIDISSATAIANMIGWSSWIPVAALYANTTQILSIKIYHFFTNLTVNINKINISAVIIFVIAACAGTSFAQIAIDFYNPEMNIPVFFKNSSIQILIYYVLIPISYLSNIGVNYSALSSLYSSGNSLK